MFNHQIESAFNLTAGVKALVRDSGRAAIECSRALFAMEETGVFVPLHFPRRLIVIIIARVGALRESCDHFRRRTMPTSASANCTTAVGLFPGRRERFGRDCCRFPL